MKRSAIIGVLYIMVFLLAVSLKIRYEKTQDKSTERETIGATDTISINLNSILKNSTSINVHIFVEENEGGVIQLGRLKNEDVEALRIKMTKNNKSYFFSFKKMGNGDWSLISLNNITLNVEESTIINDYLGINDSSLAKAANIKKLKTLVRHISPKTTLPLNQVMLDKGYTFQLFKRYYYLNDFDINNAGLVLQLPSSDQNIDLFQLDTLTSKNQRIELIANGRLSGGRDQVYMEVYKSSDVRRPIDQHLFELARSENDVYIADVRLEMDPIPYIGGPSTSILTVANGSIDFEKTKMLNGSAISVIEPIAGEEKKLRIRHNRTLPINAYAIQVVTTGGLADTSWTFQGIVRGGEAGNPCNWLNAGNIISPRRSGIIYEDQDLSINAGLEGECGIGSIEYSLQFIPNGPQFVDANTKVEVPFGATQLVVTAKAPDGKVFTETANVSTITESKYFNVSANPFLSSYTPYIDISIRNTLLSKNINFSEYRYVNGTLKLNGIPRPFKTSVKGNNLQLILPQGNYANAVITMELTLRNPSGKNITIYY